MRRFRRRLPKATLDALRAEFDEKFYLESNPDVALSGLDPLDHYLQFGWKEGRDPNRTFSSAFYAKTHGTGKVPPLLHWISSGKDAGLKTLPEPEITKAGALAEDGPDTLTVTDEELELLRREFQADFYLESNPDVASSEIDPLYHYLQFGWKEGRDPGPAFSTSFYAETHGTGDIPPLLHWVSGGRDAGLLTFPAPEALPDPDPEDPTVAADTDAEPVAEDTPLATEDELELLRREFEADFYLESNPDVASSDTDPLDHYLRFGWKEGRDPGRTFSTSYYAETHGTDDVPPLLHWVTLGKDAGLLTQPEPETPPANVGEETVLEAATDAELEQVRREFQPDFYLQHNPDVANAGIDPFDHFMMDGWRENRDPNPDFSTSFYLSQYTDIAKSGINPFAHYVLHGRNEKRNAAPAERFADARELAAHVLGLDEKAFDRIRVFFDADHYLSINDDVREAGIDPLFHYLNRGWREGRDPGKDFETAFYLDQNPDIAKSGTNPFVHWVLHGQQEGRKGRLVQPEPEQKIVEPDPVDWTAFEEDDLADITERFDSEYYLANYPEVEALGVDPRVHYLLAGWKKNYNPNADFSTSYYIDRYIDIQTAGVNPFLHYCRHGYIERRETRSYIEMRRHDFNPKVSVILPNYNHAKYLPQRIKSIADQTYDNVEIIILDDKSSDDSCDVIRETVATLGVDARLEFNTENSGNVFAQWRKGLGLATGDLIWICESDDFCEPDFLEKLVPAFADESVNIAFGRIQFSDSEGNFKEGLDHYREGAEPGIWAETLTRPACQWFSGGFGVNNVYANVGGGLFRRMELPEDVWTEARTFKICGDWFLYTHIAGAGQITFEPSAVAYFRQHELNTSASNFHKRYYYDENIRILRLLSETWGIPKPTRLKFLDKIKAQYRHFKLEESLGEFEDVFDLPEILEAPRKKTHIQLGFLGFYAGGGELFPINLANAFLKAGYTVSMLGVDLKTINEDMRARLDRRIPVYHASHLTSRGRKEFFEASGATVLNTHVASVDAFLYTLGTDDIELPFVVTLHGSYVAFDNAPNEMIDWIIENVDQWIYTADRNLEFFENRDVDWDNFSKLPNAMPRDNRPASFSRADLGIAETDTVFVLVARGIKRKGWRAAIEAFRQLRTTYGREDTHLLLVGDGDETENAKRLARNVPGVTFLGYQSEINGILRLSDCLILPSRFEGESYPLCLIQAIQEHVPSVATDIGEIRSMMTGADGKAAGLILKNQRDSRAFFAELAASMAEMCDPEKRAYYATLAEERAKIYDMDALVEKYASVYDAATA